MSQVILRDLYCEKCSLQFNKRYVYDLHLSLVHGQEIKVKKEPTACQENFEDLQQSEKQSSEHITNEVDKSLQCDKCNSFFKSKSHLKRHIESVHEENKDFECNICDVKFSRKAYLKIHMDSVHKGKEPFQCNVCDVIFSTKGNLKEHMDSVHEGKKLFQCFTQKSSMKEHIASFQEGKMPY